MRYLVAGALLCAMFAASAHAATPAAQLASVSASPLPDAALPMSLSFTGENGESRTLGTIIGETPAVVVFADYTCTNLCGPILAFAAAGLEDSGLVPGRDFRLVVIGLDPKDGLDAARSMKTSRIGTLSALANATSVLVGTPDTIRAATNALGYHYVYDTEHDQFAHPAAAYVVTREGRVARVLSGLGLRGSDLRLALVDAGQGRVGSMLDRITLHCFGFDPVRGIYTASITRWLGIAGAGTVLLLVASLSFMTLALRRRRLS